jgi:DNA-binding beta-propeller fold protein YncE
MLRSTRVGVLNGYGANSILREPNYKFLQRSVVVPVTQIAKTGIGLAVVGVFLCFFSGNAPASGEEIVDAEGKPSGFVYLMSFGSKGNGEGQFRYIEDFDTTSDGKNLLVTDAVAAYVSVFDKTTGKFLSRFGGKGDAEDQLEKPEGISVAPDGRVFVADYSTGYVKVYDKSFKWLKTFSDYGEKPGENIKSEFTCIYEGKYYMPEAGNHRVSVWDLDGKFLFTFGKNGNAEGEFNNPESIKVNSKGEFFVADLKNNRIQVFDKDGKFLRTWGETGIGDGQFNSPAGIGIDMYDNVYVTEIGNNRCQVFDSNGNFMTKFGKKGNGIGEFGNLHGCFVDKATGLLYVADTANNRCQVFKPTEQMAKRLSDQ